MGLIAGLAALGFGAADASAAVLAHYKFETGAFLEDSSPNNNDLVNSSATSVTDVPTGGGTGSALFDGNDFLSTTASLDLTSHRKIRVSWFQRLQGAGLGIVFEHGPNYNGQNGAFLALANLSTNSGAASIRRTGPDGYSLDDFPHAAPAVPGTWQKFSIVFDLDAAATTGITSVFDESGTEIGVTNTSYLATSPGSFRNETFYIGARSGGIAGVVGNIDELLIESVEVPEPATFALIAAPFALLALRRRRA